MFLTWITWAAKWLLVAFVLDGLIDYLSHIKRDVVDHVAVLIAWPAILVLVPFGMIASEFDQAAYVVVRGVGVTRNGGFHFFKDAAEADWWHQIASND
jgi:hypothetical protein